MRRNILMSKNIMNTLLVLMMLTFFTFTSCISHPSFPKKEWKDAMLIKDQDVCNISGVYKNIGDVSKNNKPYYETILEYFNLMNEKIEPEKFPLIKAVILKKVPGARYNNETAYVSIEQPTPDKMLIKIHSDDKVIFEEELYRSKGDYECTKNGVRILYSRFTSEDVVSAYIMNKTTAYKAADKSLIVKLRESMCGCCCILFPAITSEDNWIRYYPYSK